MDSAPSLRQPVPSSAAAPHTQPHQRTLQATAAHIHNHISQQKQHQQHQQGQQHQPPGQQHQQPQQQQHSQHRHYHHPAHSVPDLDMSTAHYSPLKAATAQLRSSAGYGYELAIPGPSRNLSPLAHGLRSASLSCLPEVLAGAIAGAHEEEPCDNVGTHLGPLSQTQPAQAPFHPMHQRSRTCDTTQVVGRGCLDTQHQQHSPRHRLSHSQDSGPSHGHSHSLDCRHNNMYNSGGFERQSAYGHAGVGVFGQQQQSRGLSALAASLQDLPLAGTSQVEMVPQHICNAGMIVAASESPL